MLGRSLALNQHISIEAAGETHELDALLEVDARELRLALLVLGRPVMQLQWDGQQLHEQHAAGWPSFVTGERILNDLLLVYWPPQAIAGALPTDWELHTRQGIRELSWRGRLFATVDAGDPASINLDNWPQNYHMHIASVPLGE
jgi:hypothetical protein